jgi:uncharacterized protein YdhG (YjbR/CyaY superfamily)
MAMGDVASYLSSLADGAARAAIEHAYDLARQAVPEASEGRSYGMAALIYRGRPLFSAVAAKTHLSVFPFSPAVVEAVAADLAEFDLSKGTIRFSADSPIPDQLLTRLVTLRRDEIDATSRP